MAITSTIDASVAWSKVFNVGFIRSQVCLSKNLCAKIPGVTTSQYRISPTKRTYALVNPRGFTLWVAINRSCSSLGILAIHYIVS